MKNLALTLKVSTTIVYLLLVLWVFISWVDVVTHNCLGCSGYLQYQPWNFFILLTGGVA